MHQYNWIETMLSSDHNGQPVLIQEYIVAFINVDWCIEGHDALGLILMGGEL